MAYDTPIDNKQGSIKVSELFTDEQLKLIKNAVGESGINTLRLLMNPITDSLRMQKYILHSTGQMNWTGTEIKFDSDYAGAPTWSAATNYSSGALIVYNSKNYISSISGNLNNQPDISPSQWKNVSNDILFRLLVIDENTNNVKTIDVYMTGTTGANGTTTFRDIPLNDQELIYLELDRDLLLNAADPGGGKPRRLVIENAVTGGSIVAGKTLRKVSLSTTSGMPQMVASAASTTTVNIPLAARFDWTDGIDSFRDIWWIPHGIRWPEGTRSVLGAVVVRGLETYPSTFVRTQLELQQAISDLTVAGGGIILVTDNIPLTANIAVPSGITILGRTSLKEGVIIANPTITVSTGAGFTLANRAMMRGLNIQGASLFSGPLITMNSDRAEVRDCSLRLQNVNGSTEAQCILLSGTNNRVYNCKFSLGAVNNSRVGLKFTAGSNNVDFDSYFSTET
jgi:hypothetical protein